MEGDFLILWMQPLDPRLPDVIRVNGHDLPVEEDDGERTRIVTLVVSLSEDARRKTVPGVGWVARTALSVIAEMEVHEAGPESGRQTVLLAAKRPGVSAPAWEAALTSFLTDHRLQADGAGVRAMSLELERAAQPGWKGFIR